MTTHTDPTLAALLATFDRTGDGSPLLAAADAINDADPHRAALWRVRACPNNLDYRLALADQWSIGAGAETKCKRCEGRGRIDPPCDTCDGYGRIANPDSEYTDGTMDCPDCDSEKCETCSGTGRVPDIRMVRAEAIRCVVEMDRLRSLGIHEGRACNVTGQCAECNREVDHGRLRDRLVTLLPRVKASVFEGLESAMLDCGSGGAGMRRLTFGVDDGWFSHGSLAELHGPAEVMLRPGGVLDWLIDREPLERGVWLTTIPDYRSDADDHWWFTCDSAAILDGPTVRASMNLQPVFFGGNVWPRAMLRVRYPTLRFYLPSDA